MAKKTKENATLNAEEKASKEKMNAKRAEVTAWYKESMVHLKVQLEYETILKDIEVARAERVQSQMFLSQAMAESQQPDTMPATVTTKQSTNSQSQAGSDWDANGDIAPPKRTLKQKTNV